MTPEAIAYAAAFALACIAFPFVLAGWLTSSPHPPKGESPARAIASKETNDAT